MEMSRLKKFLNQLQLIEYEAVFFRNKEDGNTFDDFSFDIKKNLKNIQPDAYFVFNKQPLILFFDFTNENEKAEIEKRDETEIHKKVWSFDISSVIFILKNEDIKVYNALNYVKKEKKEESGLEEIKIEEKKLYEIFNFWKLQSGESLEYFYKEYKKNILKKRVHQQLFENIKQAILLLKDTYSLDEKVSKLLVLRLIFSRYLIDRNIKIDKKYIEGKVEEIIKRRRSFSKLIAKPNELQKFFNYLNIRFNGVLFKESNIEISKEQAHLLSKLFNPDGVTIEEKRNLFSDFDFQFEVFDFGIIPVELISGIYETLLDEETKNSTSAVYTPPFLVDYILTKTVDSYFEKNENSSECKLFDPAMGSGIFLVQGLRRMIEREKALNPDADNDSFGKRIKEIAEQNLFGIDINEEAINVACFSVYVALLDYQDPGNIDVYKFPYLDKNFYQAHFFDLSKTEIWDAIKNQQIDFIVGNPPWKNNSSVEHLDWLKQSKFNKIVSDKQIAQSYLIRVKDFVGSHTKVALIVTSKVYYNNQADKFKEYFLRNNLISEVFDLSPVRYLIFETAKNPASILFYKVNLNLIDENSNNLVKHISLKQNRFFNEFSKDLVIEKFDQKEILQKHFIENDWMFKVALYGNTLDFAFLKRIETENKLNDFLINNTIYKGNGIIKANSSNFYPELIGLPLIENTKNQLNENYTFINNQFKILKEADVHFLAGRVTNLFKGKKIILGKRTKNESELNLSIIEVDCVFKDSLNSISFNKSNEVFINQILSTLKSNVATYFYYLTTSSWGIYYPEISLTEYLSFPYIEPTETQKKQLINLVDELLKPYKDFYKEYPNVTYTGKPNQKVLNQINTIIEEIYQVKPYEKDLIKYVLEVSRYQFQESKQDHVTSFSKFGRNKEQILRNYAEVYLQEFGKIYDDEFMQVEIYQLDHFIAMNFVLKEEKPKDAIQFIKEKTNEQQVLNKLASNLSISKITSTNDAEHNLFIQKDIKAFENNSFYIIKPNEYKCWHRAMAWYDVGEFREAIQKAELEHFNSNLDEF